MFPCAAFVALGQPCLIRYHEPRECATALLPLPRCASYLPSQAPHATMALPVEAR
jgi:hypothetical protein